MLKLSNSVRENLSLNFNLQFFFISIFLFSFTSASAQNTYYTDCALASTGGPPNLPLSMSCTNSSNDFMNSYRLQTHYIPSTTFEAIKTIPINIVIFGEDNGTGYPIPATTAAANLVNYQDWLNRANNQTQNTTCTTISPAFLPDSKIRFVIKNFYYLNNTAILNNNTSTQGNAAMSFLFQNIPSAIFEINCILLKNFHISGAAGQATTFNFNGQTIPYVITGSGFTNYSLPYTGDYFYTSSHLPHELGHHLGLNHTYNSETLDPNNIDFLDDVFNSPPAYFGGCSNVMGGADPNDYFSPKQIGRSHRSLSTDVNTLYGISPVRNFAYGFSSVPHIISGNETWDFVFKSYNDIVIKSGATLTLTCRLEMVKDAKIIVERGGKLNVDGATITSALSAGPEHEGMWEGIEVWGTSIDFAQSLSNPNFGYVHVYNGAIIENAHYGITNKKSGDWGYEGGIIRAENSTFRNNKKDIQFFGYQRYVTSGSPPVLKRTSDLSNFRMCIFETTGPLLNGYFPETHVSMNKVYGVNFLGCTFRNTTDRINGPFVLEERGKGIYSIDARFTVNAYCNSIVFAGMACPNPIPSIFESLFIGVHSESSPSIYTPSVYSSKFYDCRQGILLQGVNNALIRSNNFEVANGAASNNFSPWYAVSLENCTGYQVEDNETHTPNNMYANYAGVKVDNSGIAANGIYNNRFYDTYMGTTGQRDNGHNAAWGDGLKYNCNSYNNCSYDALVLGPLFPVSGDPTDIAPIQGFYSIPNVYTSLVRNRYSQPCLGNESQFYTNKQSSQPILHVNHDPMLSPETQPGATCKDNSVYVSSVSGVGWNPAHCISYKDVNKYSVKAVKLQAHMKIAELGSRFDGGQTALLLSIVNGPISEVDLLTELRPLAPNLSDILLKAIINRQPPLSDIGLEEVLISNASLSYPVIESLNERNPNLPETIKSKIFNANSKTPERLKLEQELGWWKSELESALNSEIGLLFDEDSLYDPTDSIINLLQTEFTSRPETKYLLASALISKKDFQGARDAILELRSQIKYRNLCSLIDIAILIEQSNKGCFYLQEDPQATAILTDIANQDSKFGSVHAKVLLDCAFNRPFETETYLPTITSQHRIAKEKKEEEISIDQSDNFALFPNPATNFLTIKYNFGNKSNLTLQVFDMLGKLIFEKSLLENFGQRQFEIADWKCGVYFCKINSGYENLAISKVIIIK